MSNLKLALTSKKFWAAIVGLLFLFLGPRAGMDQATVTQAVQVIMAYVLGQGLADIRKA